MPKLKTLFVTFDNDLAAWQVPAFRGALIEKVGREHVAFHNHVGETGLVYRYPIIQYKSIRQRPCLLCVGDGVDEIHKFFGLRNWQVTIGGTPYELKVDRLDMNHVMLNVWDKRFNYCIQNWLALNEENYRRYQQTTGIIEQVQMLEKLLVGNILSFAKGVDWHIDKPIQLQLQEIRNQKTIRYKGVPLLAFDVQFSCNVFLPNYLGLGKSASHGFGIVINRHRNTNMEQA